MVKNIRSSKYCEALMAHQTLMNLLNAGFKIVIDPRNGYFQVTARSEEIKLWRHDGDDFVFANRKKLQDALDKIAHEIAILRYNHEQSLSWDAAD